MLDVIRNFKEYLEVDCRLPHARVDDHMSCMPQIMQNLKIENIRDLSPQHVNREWRHSRWKPTQKGISISESAERGYLPVLKMFLRYLEDQQYPVSSGLADIIRIPDQAFFEVREMSLEERRQLREALIAPVSKEQQRRDQLLVLLLWATKCSLEEALALCVNRDGTLEADEEGGVRAGHFLLRDGCVSVMLPGHRKEAVEKALPDEVAVLLREYLENRSERDSRLFLGAKGRGRRRPMTVRSAMTAIYRVLSAAGIQVPLSSVDQLLLNSRYYDGQEEAELAKMPSREIVMMTDRHDERDELQAWMLPQVA